MSVKKRRRNKTIAFRMSEAEKIDLENKVKLSGKKSKQEYIISALLNHKIEAVGNPLMFLQFKSRKSFDFLLFLNYFFILILFSLPFMSLTILLLCLYILKLAKRKNVDKT